MRIVTAFFAFIFLFLQQSICCGQEQGIRFNNISPPEGYFFGLVHDITQDPKGYMWMAASDGFFRYDGHDMVNYKNDPANPNSVSNNWIESICADADGIIWLGTWGNGLDRFDPSTGKFTHFSHDPKNPSSLAQNLIPVIYEDREGELWIGTHGGLDLLNKKTGTFKHYAHDPNDPSSLSNDQVRVIYEDKQGTLWVGTGSAWETTAGRPGETGVAKEGGLNRLDRKTGKFTRYMHDDKDPHSLAQNKVRALFEDSRGNFWVGTTGGDGLQIMDRSKGTFQRYVYDPAHPEKLSRPPINKQVPYDHISFITEDVTGAIWIGTLAAGLTRYDPVTQKVKHYGYSDTADGFTDYSAWAHYISRDGIFWTSSATGSLYRVELFHTSIPHVNLAKNVTSLLEDRRGFLWIGFDSGLIQKNLTTGKTHLFTNDSVIQTRAMVADTSGNLWIGTFGEGLYRFNPQTQIFTNYRHNEKNKNSISSNGIFCLYADKDANIWIGTDSGLDAMNITTGKFTHYKANYKDSGNKEFDIVLAITGDKNGQIWTGRQGATIKLDRSTGEMKSYPIGTSTYLYEDKKGDLWVGSNDGLFKYDSAADRFSLIVNPATGLDLGAVGSMAEDDHQNLWIESPSGLIKLNEAGNTFTVYGTNAGVNGADLNGQAACRDHNGQLYFSDGKGYYSLLTGKIINSSKPPEILLTNFRIANLSVQADDKSVLNKPL